MGDVTDIDKSKNKNRRRPEQGRIPGTESKRRNDEIEKKAKKYVEARDERMELTEREVKTRADLIEAMKKHKLESYRCEDQNFLVNMTTEEKIKVTKVSDPSADRDDEGDE